MQHTLCWLEFDQNAKTQLFTGRIPFDEIRREYSVIIAVLANMRPRFPFDIPESIGFCADIWDLMEQCWHHDAAARPTCEVVWERIQHLRGERQGLYPDPMVTELPVLPPYAPLQSPTHAGGLKRARAWRWREKAQQSVNGVITTTTSPLEVRVGLRSTTPPPPSASITLEGTPRALDPIGGSVEPKIWHLVVAAEAADALYTRTSTGIQIR
jgi:hypothetical protein